MLFPKPYILVLPDPDVLREQLRSDRLDPTAARASAMHMKVIGLKFTRKDGTELEEPFPKSLYEGIEGLIAQDETKMIALRDTIDSLGLTVGIIFGLSDEKIDSIAEATGLSKETIERLYAIQMDTKDKAESPPLFDTINTIVSNYPLGLTNESTDNA